MTITSRKFRETYRSPVTGHLKTLVYSFDRTSKTHSVRELDDMKAKRFASVYMAEHEVMRLRARFADAGFTERVK